MGLAVVYHVAKLIGETTPNTEALESARYLDEHFIQKGHLGIASGPGLLPLPQSGLRATGIHLVESALEASSGSAQSTRPGRSQRRRRH